MRKLFIGFATLVSITSFAAPEEILNIKDYNNITLTTECVQRTQLPQGLGRLKSDIVIVTNLELRYNDDTVKELNLSNYWVPKYEFDNLNDCQKQIDNHDSSFYTNEFSQQAKVISTLFIKLKEQENLVFKKSTEYSCYRKELKLITRPYHYIHPVTGEKPQTIEQVRIVTPCVGSVIMEP